MSLRREVTGLPVRQMTFGWTNHRLWDPSASFRRGLALWKQLQDLQRDIKTAFVNHVVKSRGDKLSEETDLFTGAFWTGTRGVEFGLADGIGHIVPKMKEVYGEKVTFAAYGPKKGWLPRIGAKVLADLDQGLEERALYARYGLS